MPTDTFRELIPWQDSDTFLERMLSPGWFGDVRRPLMDLQEHDKKYVLTLEMPGVDKKDLHVRPRDGGIEVVAQREEEAENEEQGMYRFERNYRSFRRFCSLPPEADLEKASAKLRNGVLTLDVPKSAHAKANTKEIEVK